MVKDMIGKQFGRLTVIEYAGQNYRHRATWLCKCTCGNTKIVDGNSLRTGGTRSCGCLNDEVRKSGINGRKHGMHGTRVYRTWMAMKRRCYSKNTEDYKKWYGANGIKVCDEWLHDFMTFYKWAMENGYDDTLSIDRIDPYGDYSPDNCRWVDATTQANNKRNNVFYNVCGEKLTLRQIARKYGFSEHTLSSKIYVKKMNMDDAIAYLLTIKPRRRKAS